MKHCSNCGAEIAEDANFCTKCGSTTKKYDKEKIQNSNQKSIYAFVILMSVIGVIVLGAVLYSGNKDKNQAKLIRQKKEMLMPIEVILDIYKTNNRDYTKRLLEEYGYSFFIEDDYSEYYTKDVQLKGETDWRGDVYYEPTERKGSKVMLSKYDDSFYIEVFTEKDFLEWVKQLKNLGYKEESYGENLPMEDDWTALGAHGNLCKLYSDVKGNSIEFMKDGDGHIGYSIFTVNSNN